MRLVYWEKAASPHVVKLLEALVDGGVDVHYAISQSHYDFRTDQGWSQSTSNSVNVQLLSTDAEIALLLSETPKDTIHVVSGLRGSPFIVSVVKNLNASRVPFFLFMEMVRERYFTALPKRFAYSRLFSHSRRNLSGVLAAGKDTPNWVASRGYPDHLIFPFGYFVDSNPPNFQPVASGTYKVGFVGQLIDRKDVSSLIRALSELLDLAFEVDIVGAGPLKLRLQQEAHQLIPGRCEFKGAIPFEEVRDCMRSFDCLVLPSKFDGWGAVIPEALTAGIPVVCSDRCGAAHLVAASEAGGVFPVGDSKALSRMLKNMIKSGPTTAETKHALISWSDALSAQAGARYLQEIVRYLKSGGARPQPPWEVG